MLPKSAKKVTVTRFIFPAEGSGLEGIEELNEFVESLKHPIPLPFDAFVYVGQIGETRNLTPEEVTALGFISNPVPVTHGETMWGLIRPLYPGNRKSYLREVDFVDPKKSSVFRGQLQMRWTPFICMELTGE